MSDIRSKYVTPEVVTYSDSEILKRLHVKGDIIVTSAPQNFFGTSITDPGKRTERYRGISTRSFLEDPDE